MLAIDIVKPNKTFHMFSTLTNRWRMPSTYPLSNLNFLPKPPVTVSGRLRVGGPEAGLKRGPSNDVIILANCDKTF